MSDTRFSQSDTRFVKSDTGFDKSDIGFDQSDTMFSRTDSKSHWSLESIYGSVDRQSEGSHGSESVRRRKPSLSDNIRSNQPATKPDSSDKTPRDPELPQRKSFMSDTFRHFADLLGDLSISDPASSNYEYVEPGRCQKVESDKCQEVESDTKQPDTPIASQFRDAESKEEYLYQKNVRDALKDNWTDLTEGHRAQLDPETLAGIDRIICATKPWSSPIAGDCSTSSFRQKDDNLSDSSLSDICQKRSSVSDSVIPSSDTRLL
eukprot:772884_1